MVVLGNFTNKGLTILPLVVPPPMAVVCTLPEVKGEVLQVIRCTGHHKCCPNVVFLIEFPPQHCWRLPNSAASASPSSRAFNFAAPGTSFRIAVRQLLAEVASDLEDTQVQGWGCGL